MASPSSPSEDRWLQLDAGSARLPEKLLLAHARGEVLFITGAGTSKPSGLPDFKSLVLKVYEKIDAAAHIVLAAAAADPTKVPPHSLGNEQRAELKRFIQGDYDVVLGMLERRMDSGNPPKASVRDRVCEVLRTITDVAGNEAAPKHSPIHAALARLSNRGQVATIVTTNFDLLLQAASHKQVPKPKTFSLGAIPRPGRQSDFAGVLHIHGALSEAPSDRSDVIVTDRDFGEFYLRRRTVPDFIYDAARLFHLVLVGYSANDAPMRYLLNAVAADGSRFDDLRERFAFVATGASPDQVLLEDWKGRGITPIPYSNADNHIELSRTLVKWAELSAVNGKQKKVDAEIGRIVSAPRSEVDERSRDLFDHFVRRGSSAERVRISNAITKAGADVSWLEAILTVGREQTRPVVR